MTIDEEAQNYVEKSRNPECVSLISLMCDQVRDAFLAGAECARESNSLLSRERSLSAGLLTRNKDLLNEIECLRSGGREGNESNRAFRIMREQGYEVMFDRQNKTWYVRGKMEFQANTPRGAILLAYADDFPEG